MREVVIQIPTLETEQNIDIDVSINGRKRTMKYRVEIIKWKAVMKDEEDIVEVLRRVIHEHDEDWELIQIGNPARETIPLMFRKKGGRIPVS